MMLQTAVARPENMPRPASLQRQRHTQTFPLRRVVLTGFMGSGKSTVGPLLASQLGWLFVDLDDVVRQRTGMTVPQIFAERGEAAFRREETAALAATLRLAGCVIALGGGAPETLANRLLLEQTPGTHVVFLSAPFETLARRCASQAADPTLPGRPNFADIESARIRLQTRLPLYRRLAQTEVATTDVTLEQTVAQVLAAVAPRLPKR